MCFSSVALKSDGIAGKIIDCCLLENNKFTKQ